MNVNCYSPNQGRSIISLSTSGGFFLQFVAHPICQQVLSSIWCGNLAGWRGSRTAWKLFVSVGIFLTMPLLCLVYWIAPKSKVGKIPNKKKKEDSLLG